MSCTTQTRDRDRLAVLADSAVAVGACIALGNLRLLELPSGGSISLAMLPLIVLAAARGVRAAALAGIAAGIGHALAGGTVVHPAQLLLDYGLAYAAPALAGIGTSMVAIRLGICISAAVQLACTSLSGVIFFVPRGTDGAWIVAAAYNAVTIVPELAIALVLAPTIVAAHARAQPRSRLGERWRRAHLPPVRSPRTIGLDSATPQRSASPLSPRAASRPARPARHLQQPLPSLTARIDGRLAPIHGGNRSAG